MDGKFMLFVALTIFLLAESTTGIRSEQHLTQKRQSIRAKGCIAAGFTRCCAFGACRVDLPDGGHCFCDRVCLYSGRYSFHNCCSDNPCEGLSFEKYQYFVGEGDGFVEVCGNLYGRQGLTVTARFYPAAVTTNTPAKARHDFVRIYEVLQMTSGERKCWNVTILDDSIDEGVESFQVSLHAASFRSAYAPVFIADNDGGKYLKLQTKSPSSTVFCDGSLNRVTVEGDDPLEICVRITGSEGETVIVNVDTEDGTATAHQDYIASNQTLTFTTPERKCFRIEILDDSEVERNEYFYVYLILPTDTGRQVLSRCGYIAITDNDAPTLEQISFIVDEGVGSVEVCMHFGGEGLNITATVNTDGTATRGSDYNFTTQNFTMNSGERRCTSIEILDDAIVEQTRERFTENIRVQFRSDAYVDIFIRDNDGPAFESNYYYVDEGAGAVEVCMHLGGEGLVDNVTLFTRSISALAGRDYSGAVQTFTVYSGQRKCMSIRILNDTIPENFLEYFRVHLSSIEYPDPPRYTTVYIQDNDGRDLVSIGKHQEYTGSGCIAAGFTRCCEFGSCRVDLPEGGHCYCDWACFTRAQHNCCSDNPCDVVKWERRYYYASESDDSVEVCLQSGQTQGIAHAYSKSYPSNPALDSFDEWLKIVPGGRQCFNITLVDDGIFDLQDRNRREYLYLWLASYSTSRVNLNHAQVMIVDDEMGKKYKF